MNRRTAFVLLAMAAPVAVWPMLSFAGPGHDHGGGATATTAAAVIPRIESVTPDLELVATAEGHKLTIYLDKSLTNEPVEGAKIEVLAEGQPKAEAKPLGDGVYLLDADWIDKPGTTAIVFTVTTADGPDLLNGTLDIPGPQATAAPAPLDFKALMVRLELWVWTSIAALLGFFASFAFRPARAPRDDPPATLQSPTRAADQPTALSRAASVVLAAGLAFVVMPDRLMAGPGGPGHSHGESGAAAPAGGNVPRRAADGTVFLPKPSQRLLRVRTVATARTTAPQASELLGTVIADPRAAGRVQAPFAGRVDVEGIDMAFTGQRVAQGDILAALAPTVSSLERGSVGQQLAELDGNITLAEQKLARLAKLVGSVPQGDIDTARAEVATLKERRKALSPSLFGREVLRAPVAGVIASANVRAGQVVDAREVLFEIVDPARLWVEAIGFAAIDETTIRGAHAVIAPGKSAALTFLGRAPELKQQSVPLLFRVEDGATGLTIGRAVSVVVQTNSDVDGMVLPEAAIVRASNGLPQVWEKVGAETFAARAVRTAPLDGQRVMITDGLEVGQRIVVSGAEFINQVR